MNVTTWLNVGAFTNRNATRQAGFHECVAIQMYPVTQFDGTSAIGAIDNHAVTQINVVSHAESRMRNSGLGRDKSPRKTICKIGHLVIGQ